MKDNELNSILPEEAKLDAALAQMAEEVPPMPADFHERWMKAVRAEAENAAPEPVPEKNTVSVVRWTRILSIAAVFVFLIGGTMLHRNAKKTLSASYTAEKREAAESAAAPAAEVLSAGEDQGIQADPEEPAGDFAVMDTWMQAAAVEEAEEADAAGEAGETLSMKAAGAALNAFAAVPAEAPVAGAATESAAEVNYAAEADYEAEAAVYDTEPAAAEAPVPASTQAPAPTAAPLPEEASETKETEKAEETEKTAEEPANGFLQDAGAFFADMGDFLLAALPYLLVLAVPAAAALVIRRKKARRS